MTARGRLAAFLAMALQAGALGAAEAKPPAPKAPAAEAKAPAPAPAGDAAAPEAPAESAAARAERLAKLYDAAEALYREGRLGDSQKLYAQIALEDPNFRRVGSRLASIRTKLQEEEKRAHAAQIEDLLAAADAEFAAGHYEAASKACETVLAIQPRNRRAQQRLAECAGELDLRRRVTSIIAEPGDEPAGRQVLAQAGTALREGAAETPEPAPPQGGPPVVRSPREMPIAPPKAPRPAAAPEAAEAPPAKALTPAAPAAEADPEGRRLIREAWDLAESAKLAQDARPTLHKALDTLAPITVTSGHSERSKQTAALLRRSITRRLAEEGRTLSPEEARKARLYQRYLEAEELFRKRRFDECAKATDEILAEDRHFQLARTLSQEARIKAREEETAEKDLEHRMTIERRHAETEEMSTPPDNPRPVPRPAIDLARARYDVASPELQEKLNQRVSVNLIDADLDYFLDLLFRSTGVNLIYNPEVVTGKTITVHIANYPLRELLDYIAKNHGLLFTTTQDGVLITTPDQPMLESFVLPLNYGLIDVEEAPPSGAVAGQGAAAQPLTPSASSNLEKLVAALPQLIEWPQGSFTYLDRKMNLLYVRTTRAAYHEVLRMIDPIDQIATQVLIKTLFVDVRTESFESAGVKTTLDWLCGTSTAPRHWDFTNHQWVTGPFTEYREGNATLPFTGERLSSEGNEPAQFTWTGVFDQSKLELVLDALQRIGDTRTLAAPSVICINNCTASISATETLVYIEDYEVDRSDISGTSYGNPYYYQQQQQVPGQTTPTYQQPLSSEPVITPVFSEDEYTGIVLDVAPSIGKDTRYITLTLNPRYREKVDEITVPIVLPVQYYQSQTPTTGTGTGTGTASSATQQPTTVNVTRPIISERAISTKLTVADGSVVGIGGLTRHSKIQNRSKIPILGDIPILGWLFSNTSYHDTKSNLLIFIQVEVITPTGARYADSGRVDESVVAPSREPVQPDDSRPPVVRPAPKP